MITIQIKNPGQRIITMFMSATTNHGNMNDRGANNKNTVQTFIRPLPTSWSHAQEWQRMGVLPPFL